MKGTPKGGRKLVLKKMADILPSSSEKVSNLSSSEKFDELNQSMDKLGFQQDIEGDPVLLFTLNNLDNQSNALQTPSGVDDACKSLD